MKKILLPTLLLLGNFLLFEPAAFAQCSVSAGNNSTICAGKSITLKAVVTGGTPTSYNWTSNPSGSYAASSKITVTPAVTTTYTVHTSGNGCSATGKVTVAVTPAPPAPGFTFGPNDICSGSQVGFSVNSPDTSLSYSWSFGDGTTDTGSNPTHNFYAYGSGNKNFTVTLTAINAAGCGGSSTQTVTVIQGAQATLGAGPSVDTVTFNGAMTFYQCASSGQQNGFFTFENTGSTVAGATYTIIWGDGSANYTTNSAWTSATHTYARGNYDLTYIINPNSGGCGDTINYVVFFGSNPGGGIGSLGNTDICGPGNITFAINNFANNSAGTIYTIKFNDGTPPLVFTQPPPNRVTHYFTTASCGVTSTDGVNVFNNSYSASLTIQNPCGTTAAAVVPIYISTPPVADYAPPGPACTGVNGLYVNTSKNGSAASSTGCDSTTPILWQVIPATGWSITVGSLGNNNGMTGANFDPGLWTPGSNTLGINFSTPGNYQVMLIAANYCGPDSIIKTICVSSPASPTFSLSSESGLTSGCAPIFDSMINITPPGFGCAGNNFAWSIQQVSSTCNPDSLLNYKILQANQQDTNSIYVGFYNQGTYNISLSATNVCGTFTSAPQTITIDTKPQLNMGLPSAVCFGTSFSPDANPSACGGTISSYAWSFPGATPSSSTNQNPGVVTYPTTGTYTVSLAVTNQCGTADTVVPLVIDSIPIAHAGSATQTCSGVGVQIGSTPNPDLSYTWTPSTGLNAANIANPIVTIIDTGTVPIVQTYYVQTSNPIGCGTTDSVVVTIYPAATVGAGPPIGACSGQSLQLNGYFGGAATSATWSSNNGGTFSDPSSPTSSYTPTITSGTVTLTLTTNVPGIYCPAVSSSTTVTVVAPPVANPGNNVAVCSGASVQIGSPQLPGYTYTWAPPTGLDTTGSATPTATLVNNSDTVLLQTYTLTVSAVGCSSTAQVVDSVYPAAGVMIDTGLSVCAGSSVVLTGFLSGSASSATWSSPSGNFSSYDSLTTTFTPSISSGIAEVTLITNQPSHVCPNANASVPVIVNSGPLALSYPTSQTVCSGGTSQPIQLTSNIDSVTYYWTALLTSNITGFIPDGDSSNIPAQTLNDSSTSGSGYIIYSAYASALGCPGPPIYDTITVNPFFTVAPIPDQTICSGASTAPINLDALAPGATFIWTSNADNNLHGFISGSSDTIPSQTITNTSPGIDSVMYTVSTSANGCTALPLNYTVTVNPAPQIFLPAAQIICSGTSTQPINITSATVGATFQWTAIASSGLSGYADTGSGNIPAQTINDSNTVNGTVIYNIIGTANGCNGPNQFYVIDVNPVPAVSFSPAADSICSGMQATIALYSDMYGTSFNWTVDTPALLTGASSGNGDSIIQTLTNNGPINALVSYIITPSAFGCAGYTDTVNITVKPGINVQFSPASQSICSGSTTQTVNISSPTPGATFSWTASANGLNGVITSGTDSIPTQTLVNNTGAPDTAKYLVSVAGGGCSGQVVEFDIAVQSPPTVTVPPGQTVCGGNASTAITLSSNVPGATFTWTASSSNGVTGYIDSGSTAVIPSQVLNDTSALNSGSVIYTIQATGASCQGPPVNDTIFVSPALTVNPVAPQTICSGATTQTIIPTSNTAGATFTWQGAADQNVQGYAVSGSGNIPAQTLTNTGFAMDSVVYFITPVSTGCNANPQNVTIYINPLPVIGLPADQVVCNQQPTTLVAFSSSLSGTTYSWSAIPSPGLSGYTANGTGSIPPQTIANADSVTDTLEYQVTPSANGCTGQPADYLIAVKPSLGTIINVAADTLCAGMQTDIQLSSQEGNVNFSWVAIAGPGITGAQNGNGNAIEQTLNNRSAVTEAVTYIISSSASTCSGVPDTVNVTVTPVLQPDVSLPAQTICSGQGTQAVNITVAGNGASLAWTADSNGVSGVIPSGTNIIPAQTLTNNGNINDTVVYSITSTNAGCTSQAQLYNIIVNPIVNTLAPPNLTVCGGNASTPISLSSNVTGATFTWSATSINGVTGYVDSGSTSTIPSQILSDTSASQSGSVVYTIQATQNACPGPPASFTIFVTPALTVNPIAPQTICSGATTQIITPTSSTLGTTFNWQGTGDQNMQGYSASGSGNIPAQTITNTGFAIDSVVYAVTPVATGCNANPMNVTIYVNPVPSVSIPASQLVCNDQPTALVTLTSDLSGTTFSWSAQPVPGLSGFDTAGTGNIPQQIIENADTTVQTLDYHIIPSANGCPGQAADYLIAVKPGLGTIINLASATICTGTQTNIQLSSQAANVNFTWTVNAPGDISGAQSGSGNAIQQTLVNKGSFAETVTYIISSSDNTCSGVPDSVSVLVNPILVPQVSLPGQTVCSGQSTQPVNISVGGNGATLAWTANANGVLGVTPSGTNSIPSQTLTNNGNASATVVYSITSTNAGCQSQPVLYNIVVNPVLTTLLPAAQTICSGQTTDSITLSSTVPGTTFNWTAYSASVTGFMIKGSSSVIPAQTLTNNTDSTASVTYNITPSNGTCSGTPANYVIAVNPQPNVILPALQTICNGSSTQVVSLSSDLPGVTFNWVSSSDSGVSGASASGIGNIPPQTLTNSEAITAIVVYTITPSNATCTGANANFVVSVNPTLQAEHLPAPQTVCSGQTSVKVALNSAMPGVNITWHATVPSGITGADTSGNGFIPSQTLFNNSQDSIPQLLTIAYNIRLSFADSSCPAGTSNYSITVKPKPEADFNVSGLKGCSPLNVNVIPTTLNYGIPDSLVFNWGDGTSSQAAYPNNTEPLWPSLNHTFYNNSNKTDTFNIVMTAPGECADLSVTHPVIVLPGKVSAFFTASPASGCAPLNVTFHDESVGAAILSWCFNYVTDSCIGGGVVDSAGSIITHTFNAGTYTVALYATNGPGCAQDTVYQTIHVTPSPNAAFISSAGLCADKGVTFTQQASAPGGSFISEYQWSFGDGDSSLAENPVHEYDTAGTYTVCLTVSSSFGCTNQTCNPVIISSKPVADFVYGNACVNQQVGQFTSQSNGATIFQWSFGDGAMASSPDPVHDYVLPGVYTVTMIASNSLCSDTVMHPVTIYGLPNAAFSLPQTFSCGLPSTVQLTNNSTGAYAYSWDFGNGTVSEFTDPTATFIAQGTYTITLIASNQSNCFDTVQKSITIYPYPSVQSVTVTPAEGCQPLDVHFYANATNASQFVWNFGDGTSQTTTLPYASHLYLDTGTFSVLIQVYSYTACGDTILLPDTVNVHINPTAGFDYLINENVEPENGTVQFVNTSTNSTSYVWNFGDGSISDETNPAHFFADIDNFQVMLIASNAWGCKDSVIKDVYVIKKSLYAPNAFAPDYSGVENLVREWKPAGMGLATYHAQIFDKWGELLWESTALTPDLQPADGWDGTYQGKMCQQDVYVWKIVATFVDGTLWKGMSYPKEPERKTIGSVTLIR